MSDKVKGKGNNLDVLIIMGSESDLSVMEKAKYPIKEARLVYEIRVCSAHRTPKDLDLILIYAKERDVKVIIAGAGMAAHLPGVIASKVTVPVIGVPIVAIEGLGGIDALYSIVQMPPGTPVATVAINGAMNAGILAVQIVSPRDAIVYRDFLANNFKETTKRVYF